MLNEREFKVYDQLVKKIYQSFTPETLCSVILEHLSLLVPHDSAAFFQVDPQTHHFSKPYLTGLDSKNFEKYAQYYENKDIYKSAVFAGNKIPPVDRSSDYIEYNEWAKNEHRTDFLIPQGIYHIACLQVINHGKLVGEISLHRGKGSPDFNNDEMAILSMLHDHINNAFLNASLLNRKSPSNIKDDPGCDHQIGLCMLDFKYRIVAGNSRAQNILAQKLLNGQSVYNHFQATCLELAGQRRLRQNCAPHIKTGFLPLTGGITDYKIIVLDDGPRDQINFLAMMGISPTYTCAETGLVNRTELSLKTVFTAEPQPVIQIRMLGNLDVLINGQRVPEKTWQTRKTKALFKYLVLLRGQKVGREQLMELLWPEAEPAAAAAALRVTLTRLRRALASAGAHFAGKTPFFGDERGMLWFNPGGEYFLDIEEFERLYQLGLTALETKNEDAVREYFEMALAIYRGNLLEEDFYEDWAATERERLLLMSLNILLTLARLYLGAGGNVKHNRAIDLLQRALAVNPYRDETYLALMAAYQAAGQKSEALRIYEQCRKMLAEEFGVPPGRKMLKLVEEIKKNI